MRFGMSTVGTVGRTSGVVGVVGAESGISTIGRLTGSVIVTGEVVKSTGRVGAVGSIIGRVGTSMGSESIICVGSRGRSLQVKQSRPGNPSMPFTPSVLAIKTKLEWLEQ